LSLPPSSPPSSLWSASMPEMTQICAARCVSTFPSPKITDQVYGYALDETRGADRPPSLPSFPFSFFFRKGGGTMIYIKHESAAFVPLFPAAVDFFRSSKEKKIDLSDPRPPLFLKDAVDMKED